MYSKVLEYIRDTVLWSVQSLEGVRYPYHKAEELPY